MVVPMPISIEVTSSPSSDESDVEVKTAEEKKLEDDECCILNFNPFDSADVVELKKRIPASLDQGGEDDEELSVIAEKGKVACRDYPHSRHLCAEFPFNSTPHESYCPQCYCYVCDIAVPCFHWKGSELMGHCNASDQSTLWKEMRRSYKERSKKPSKDEGWVLKVTSTASSS